MSKENALFPQVKDAITFDTLWQQAKDAITAASGDIWTDTGDADPGITLLQAVTWNSSDLCYRTSLSLNDLLTREGEAYLFPEDFGPHNVLTCNTVTADDYRRALRDIHRSDIPSGIILETTETGFLVQDALLIREPEASRFNWWYDAENREYTFTQPEGADEAKHNVLRGNNWLYVVPSRFTQALNAKDRVQVEQYLADFLADHRNLGEFFSRIIWLQPVTFSPQFSVALTSDISDVNLTVAHIYQTLEALIAPGALRQSTQQMQQAGISNEDIFVGPHMQHGWQSDRASAISEAGITLNLSQLFNQLLAIPGVESISGFKVGALPPQITSQQNDAWSWTIETGYYPLLWGDDPLAQLAAEDGPLTLIAKGGIYEKVDPENLKTYLLPTPLIQTMPVTLEATKLRDLSAYTPVADRLPECYQLQYPTEVIDNHVRELHQFLLTADQQLADGCAELAALPQLLAFSGRDKNNFIRGTRWPFAADSISQQVHQQYARSLTDFQQRDVAIFTADGAPNMVNFYRELAFIQDLLGYFGTSRADKPLTLDLADFLATQRAYLAQQPSLGYDRINIRIDQISALQKRIAARIGLNSGCFTDNPDLGTLPFYLVEHRQLLPLQPEASYNSPQAPDDFISWTKPKISITKNGSAGKIKRGQLIDLIAIEENGTLYVRQQLVTDVEGDKFFFNTANSLQLKNDLERVQIAWNNKKLSWQNSNVWLQDMDYRLNYADSTPNQANQRLLASNDQSPYPAMVAQGDKIIIRRTGLSLNQQRKAAARDISDEWMIEAQIIELDAIAGTMLIEKTHEDQPDFPSATDAWRYQWNFSEAAYATADRFSFAISIVQNRSLLENDNIDAARLTQWLQQTIMTEFPAHVSLINHWLSDSQFSNFAATYKRWQNNGTPLGDDAFAIMTMLTLGHLPVAELGIGLMRIATEEQRSEIMGSNGSEWHSEIILSEELFYIPKDE